MSELKLRDFELYNNGKVIQFIEGDSILVRDKINYTSTEKDFYHTVQQGDSLTQISYNYYKDFTDNASKYWRYIADINEILNPFDISAYIGKTIVVPDFISIKLKE